LFVSLLVNMVTPEQLDMIAKFSVHHPVVERMDKFKNGYIGCTDNLTPLMFSLNDFQHSVASKSHAVSGESRNAEVAEPMASVWSESL